MTLSHNSTEPDAPTVAGYPLRNASQRRRLAERLTTSGFPEDAALAAAGLLVAADHTVPGAVTASWADLNVPNLRAASHPDGADGPALHAVGWWQGLDLPWFRIGDWTPNGAPTYTAITHTQRGRKERELAWPEARPCPDGAWEVVVKATQWAQTLPTSDFVGPRRRALTTDQQKRLFAGGLVRVPVGYVRYLDSNRRRRAGAWVALGSLEELIAAHNHVATWRPATLTRGFAVENLHRELRRTDGSAVSKVVGMTLMKNPDLDEVARHIAAKPRRRKGNDVRDVHAVFDSLPETEAVGPDTYPGAFATVATLAERLAEVWSVSVATAKKRVEAALSDQDCTLRSYVARAGRADGPTMFGGDPGPSNRGVVVLDELTRTYRVLDPDFGSVERYIGVEVYGVSLRALTHGVPFVRDLRRRRENSGARIVVDATVFDAWWDSHVQAVKNDAEAELARHHRESAEARRAAQKASWASLPESTRSAVKVLAGVAQHGPSRVIAHPDEIAVELRLTESEAQRVAEMLRAGGVEPVSRLVGWEVSDYRDR